MRLLQARIQGFGQYRKRAISFGNGLNLIHGENESGKTTLMKFIEGVLYGFEKPATGTFTEDLEKYRPWDKGPYGGTLLYECGGRRIAVFRDFNSQLLMVTDIASGEDITGELTDHNQLVRLSPDRPKLLLSPAAFRNTVSIVQGHSALEMSEVRSELEENIENLTSTGDEALSVRKSLARLENRMREIGSEEDPETGLGKLAARENELKKELIEAKKTQDRRRLIERELWELPDKPANLDEARYVVEQAASEEQKEYLRSLDTEEQETVRKRDALSAAASEANDRFEELVTAEQTARQTEEKLAAARSVLAGRKEKADEIETLKNEVPEVVGTPAAWWIPALLGAFFIAGLVLQWMADPLFLIMSGVALAALVFWFLKWNGERRTEEQRVLEANTTKEKLAGESRTAEALAEEAEKAVHSLEEELEQAGRTREEILHAAGVQTLAEYREQMNRAREQAELSERAARLEKERAAWLNRTASDLLVSRRRLLQSRLSALPEAREAENITRELTEVSREKEKASLERNSLAAAYEAIFGLSKEIRREVAPVLSETMRATVQKVTNGRYENVRIGDDGRLAVVSGSGETVGLENLSAGTGDQLYFSLRLSMVDILSPEEKLPLILDDAFYRYDENRLQNILEVLSTEAKTRQILLFTCQNREREFLAAAGVPVHYQELQTEKGSAESLPTV